MALAQPLERAWGENAFKDGGPDVDLSGMAQDDGSILFLGLTNHWFAVQILIIAIIFCILYPRVHHSATSIQITSFFITIMLRSMGAGQLLNGLAGPVTQAAPTLLSSTWFPSEQRTTSTAVAALCGSLGVAISFVIGPLVVTDVKYELDRLIPDRGNVSKNLR